MLVLKVSSFDTASCILRSASGLVILKVWQFTTCYLCISQEKVMDWCLPNFFIDQQCFYPFYLSILCFKKFFMWHFFFLYIKNTVLYLYLSWSLNYIVAIRLLDFSGWIYVRDESTTRDKLAIELNFCSICPLGHDTLNLCFCVSWDLSLGFY